MFGLRQGDGTFVMPNGAVYTGHFEHNQVKEKEKEKKRGEGEVD